MHNKDYKKWHHLKSSIEDDAVKQKIFRESEIWWCVLGLNIGHEQDGKNAGYERPVLILRKFNPDMFWALPLTSKNKISPFHHKLENQKSSVVLSQIKLLSAKRLNRRISHLSNQEFDNVKNKFINLLIKKADPFGSSGA